MGKKRRKRGRGPSGKSVAANVYESVVQRNETLLAELAAARVRMEAIERLLIAVVRTAGSPMQVDYPPADSKLELSAHERDGGVLLFLTDLKADDGQEGKDDDSRNDHDRESDGVRENRISDPCI